MKLSNFDRLEKGSLIHAAIGGVINFFGISLLFDLSQMGLQQILIYLGVIGITIFKQEFTLARDIFMFGVVFLSSGFCGGLYTGYKVKKDLKIILFLPGVIGFVIFIILYYFQTGVNLFEMNIAGETLFPLLGCIVGAYLGGYTLNWPSEDEEVTETGKLKLELGE